MDMLGLTDWAWGYRLAPAECRGGTEWGYSDPISRPSLSGFSYLSPEFDSDLGHHQIFKHCCALDLGACCSVVRHPERRTGRCATGSLPVANCVREF